MYRGVIFVLSTAGVLSSFNLNNELCRRDDTGCITRVSDKIFRAAIKGDPLLNIETLDPLHVDYIHGNFFNTNYKMVNSTVIGFKTCHVVHTKLVLEKNKMDFKLFCPHIYMYGEYEISGMLIVVPIEGRGDYTLDSKDYYFNIETATKIIQADDGKRYLQYKNFKAIGDLQGGMATNLTNLFNGQNNDLAQAALKFANQYPRPVAKELQGPIVNTNIKRIVKNINKYLKKVPLDTLVIY